MKKFNKIVMGIHAVIQILFVRGNLFKEQAALLTTTFMSLSNVLMSITRKLSF